MQDLTLTLVQEELTWLDPPANRERFSRLIKQIEQPTDLIILPEMFSTGFTMEPERVCEPLSGANLKWMQRIAADTDSAVTGSFVVQEGKHYFNRLLFVYPDGDYRHYDKRHLFRMANEQTHYKAGEQRLILDYKGWRICPLICYDLRFPVWSRNLEDYDLLIYVANWPAKRSSHWLALLRARAIENLCFVAGVNRVGKDGNGYDYSGDSALFDARGVELIPPKSSRGSYSCTLKYSELSEYREKFPAHLDADRFELVED